MRWLGRRLFYRAPLHHSLQYRGIARPMKVGKEQILGLLAALDRYPAEADWPQTLADGTAVASAKAPEAIAENVFELSE